MRSLIFFRCPQLSASVNCNGQMSAMTVARSDARLDRPVGFLGRIIGASGVESGGHFSSFENRAELMDWIR